MFRSISTIVLIPLIFSFSSGCGQFPSNSEIDGPELPPTFTEALPESESISIEDYRKHEKSKRLKILSQKEVEKDFLTTASQISLDAMTVSQHSSHKSAQSSHTEDTPPPSAPYVSISDEEGTEQVIRLQDREAKIHSLAEIFRSRESQGISQAGAPVSSYAVALDGSNNLSEFSGICQDNELPRLATRIGSEHLQWPLKNHLPCIKSQGVRGTCTAFSTVSALEALVSAQLGQKVALSPQALYNYGKMFWPINSTYSDGYHPKVYLKRSLEDGYRIPLLDHWSYNSSPNRTIAEKKYQNSCQDYDGYCSDTAHQGKLVCAHDKKGTGEYLCGYLSQVEDLTKGVRVLDYEQLWDPENPGSALQRTREHLALGYPVIIDTELTPRFTSQRQGFLVQKKEGDDLELGSHSMVIYFTVSAQLIRERTEFASRADPFPEDETFYAVANSWGPKWGDRGFVYLPESYLKQYAHSLLAIRKVDLQ